MKNNYPQYRKIVFAFFAVLVLIGVVVRVTAGNGAVNPAKDTLKEDVNAGIKYALLYKEGALYDNINGDDKNLRLIQDDLALFAKTTIPKFSDGKYLIGFTFDDKFTTNQNTFMHSGHYYGVPERIDVSVTVYETGVISLSLTNTKDKTNIDEYLNLNGSKNRLLARLPIESDFYSIRHSKSEDKIIAAFYRGYSNDDVDMVVKILNDAYGGSYDTDDIVFNINAVGIFNIDEVRKYSSSPDNIL